MKFKNILISLVVLILLSGIASAAEEISWTNTKTEGTGVVITSPLTFTTCDISPDGGSGWDTCYAYLTVLNNNKDVTAMETAFEAVWKAGNVRNVRYEYTKDSVQSVKISKEKIISEPDKSKGELVGKETTISTSTDIKTLDKLSTEKPAILKGESVTVKITFEKPRWTTASFDFEATLAGLKSVLDPDVGACGTLAGDGGTWTLNQSVNSSGTCFTITGNNTVFNGSNYSIYFANVSTSLVYGITVASRYNVTIKNVNIYQNNSSAITDIIGVKFFSVNNSFITNVNATVINGTFSYGIQLSTNSNNNTISGSTGTSNSRYGIYLTASASDNILISNIANSNTSQAFYLGGTRNIFTSNIGRTNKSYGFFVTSLNNSTFTNNIGISNTDGGLQLELSHFNTFISNTFFANNSSTSVEDIAIDRSYRNNTFINTNWSTYRKLKFYEALDEFNMSNNSGTSYVNTKVNIEGITNRSIVNWNQSNITFSENYSGTTTSTYTVSGLVPNFYYYIYENSTLNSVLLADNNGLLPDFNIVFTTSKKSITIKKFDPISLIGISPINGSNVSGIIPFIWNEQPQDFPYILYISADNAFLNIVSQQTLSSYTDGNYTINISGLPEGIKYYWHVNNSTGSYTNTMNFTMNTTTAVSGRFNISVVDEQNFSKMVMNFTIYAYGTDGSLAIKKSNNTGWVNFTASEVISQEYLLIVNNMTNYSQRSLLATSPANVTMYVPDNTNNTVDLNIFSILDYTGKFSWSTSKLIIKFNNTVVISSYFSADATISTNLIRGIKYSVEIVNGQNTKIWGQFISIGSQLNQITIVEYGKQDTTKNNYNYSIIKDSTNNIIFTWDFTNATGFKYLNYNIYKNNTLDNSLNTTLLAGQTTYLATNGSIYRVEMNIYDEWQNGTWIWDLMDYPASFGNSFRQYFSYGQWIMPQDVMNYLSVFIVIVLCALLGSAYSPLWSIFISMITLFLDVFGFLPQWNGSHGLYFVIVFLSFAAWLVNREKSQ